MKATLEVDQRSSDDDFHAWIRIDGRIMTDAPGGFVGYLAHVSALHIEDLRVLWALVAVPVGFVVVALTAAIRRDMKEPADG